MMNFLLPAVVMEIDAAWRSGYRIKSSVCVGGGGGVEVACLIILKLYVQLIGHWLVIVKSCPWPCTDLHLSITV